MSIEANQTASDSTAHRGPATPQLWSLQRQGGCNAGRARGRSYARRGASSRGDRRESDNVGGSVRGTCGATAGFRLRASAPRSLRPNERTRVFVLATIHLNQQVPDKNGLSGITALLSALEQFKPEVIAVERLSGRTLEGMERQASTYDTVLSTLRLGHSCHRPIRPEGAGREPGRRVLVILGASRKLLLDAYLRQDGHRGRSSRRRALFSEPPVGTRAETSGRRPACGVARLQG